MKPILLFALVLFTAQARSQSDTDTGRLIICTIQVPLAEKQIYKPVFRLTAKDIAHLPFVSIMEVINGRFPFAFADAPSAAMYTFIVNGHLVINPNAIDVSQIALIEFYPVSFDAGSGSLSSHGTIVITTKKGATGTSRLSIRSQTGILFPTDKIATMPAPGSVARLENELFTYQEAGYSYNKGKLQFNISGSFTKHGVPDHQEESGAIMQNATHDFYRQRLSIFGTYKASTRLHLSLSLLGTTQMNNSGSNSLYASSQTSEYKSESDNPYAGAAFAIEYRSQHMTNTLQFEYARTKRELDAISIFFPQPPNPPVHNNSIYGERLSRFAVVNTTKGTFNSYGITQFGWQLMLRYHERRENTEYITLVYPPSGPPTSVTAANSSSSERSLAAMPGFNIEVNNQLFAQVGVVYDHWRNTAYLDRDKELILPYAAVRWEAPVRSPGLSSLSIHSSFGKSLQFNYRMDIMDIYSLPGFAPLQGPVFALNNPSPGVNWITGVNTGFLNNKILFSVNYLFGNGFPGVARPVPGGTVVLEYREVKRNGLSADLVATIAERKKFSCKFRTMLFYEQVKLKEPLQGFTFRNYNPFLNDDLSPQWKGSVSLDASSGNFFLQVQGLLRFNDEGYNNFRFSGERIAVSNHGLTFLVVGYSFPLNKSDDQKRLDISLQTKNLAVMKEPGATQYYGSRYVGLGVNFRI